MKLNDLSPTWCLSSIPVYFYLIVWLDLRISELVHDESASYTKMFRCKHIGCTKAFRRWVIFLVIRRYVDKQAVDKEWLTGSFLTIFAMPQTKWPCSVSISSHMWECYYSVRRWWSFETLVSHLLDKQISSLRMMDSQAVQKGDGSSNDQLKRTRAKQSS